MELVQGYLDIWQPSPAKIKQDYAFYGYQVGTLSVDGLEVSFGFKNMSYQANRQVAPLYSGWNPDPRQFVRGSRSVEIEMNILLDNNDLYQMLNNVGNHKLKLKTNLFEADVMVRGMNYMHMSTASMDEISADVSFFSTGEFKILEQEYINRQEDML